MIQSFEEYVAHYCIGISYDKALDYAFRGDDFLRNVAAGDIQINQDMTVISTCIIWCLIKNSYDAGLPFGKGMFNLEFPNDSITKSLYEALKSYPQAYHRWSSHYNDRAKTHLGIDNHIVRNEGAEYVPSPWKFKTTLFGLCTEPDGSQTLFIKPETRGLNFKRNPVESMHHLWNWVKKRIKPQRLPRTQNFREDEHVRDSVRGDVLQIGNEIRFKVDPVAGVVLRTEQQIDNTKRISFRDTYKEFENQDIFPELQKVIVEHFNSVSGQLQNKLQKSREETSPEQRRILQEVVKQLQELNRDWSKFLDVTDKNELIKVTTEYSKVQREKYRSLQSRGSWRSVKSAVYPTPEIERTLEKLHELATKLNTNSNRL